jgi:hypothetical protein
MTTFCPLCWEPITDKQKLVLGGPNQPRRFGYHVWCYRIVKALFMREGGIIAEMDPV